MSKPVSVNVNTFGKSNIKLSDSEISNIIINNFDLSPYSIQEEFNLRKPIYSNSACYGNFGRIPKIVNKVFESPYNGKTEILVELFPWEKLDLIDKMKRLFKYE